MINCFALKNFPVIPVKTNSLSLSLFPCNSSNSYMRCETTPLRHRNTHMLGLHVLRELSIDLMIFILYKLYILSPNTHHTPKSPHHRKHLQFYMLKKHHLIWFIQCFLKMSLRWFKMFSSWGAKNVPHTHTHCCCHTCMQTYTFKTSKSMNEVHLKT